MASVPYNRVSPRQRAMVCLIGRYETPGHGVTIPTVTADALVARGLASVAPRDHTRLPPISGPGIPLRLTARGRKFVERLTQ